MTDRSAAALGRPAPLECRAIGLATPSRMAKTPSPAVRAAVASAAATPAVSIVNNATGVIRGGAGGDGSNGLVNAGSPQAAAGAGGSGGIGVAISRGSILNFGQIFGGAAGDGADATVAGEVGGSDPFDGGGVGREPATEYSSSPAR